MLSDKISLQETAVNAAQCGIYSLFRLRTCARRLEKIRNYAKKKQGTDHYRICQKLNITIITKKSGTCFSMIDFKNKEITLFEENLKKMQKKLDSFNVLHKASDLAVAHELFHYIAHKNKKITQYEELEAHYFVKELFSLPFLPIVLE